MFGEVLRLETLTASITQTALGAMLLVQVHGLQHEELRAKPARP